MIIKFVKQKKFILVVSKLKVVHNNILSLRVWMMMGDESGKSPRRLSQIFDPLSRLSELTRASHSTPSSPHLLPRRNRDVSSTVGGFDSLDPGCSTTTSNGTVNWQERCLELQLELHRSRAQATRTRDMLRDKVRRYTLFF